jgi:hypothetical protein
MHAAEEQPAVAMCPIDILARVTASRDVIQRTCELHTKGPCHGGECS